MHLPFKIRITIAPVVVLLVAGMATPGEATGRRRHDTGISPALCGPDDIPEPGIQGDVPPGTTPNWSCGLTLVGQLPGGGAVQGAGQCAYQRSGSQVRVIDVSDPTNPVEVGSVPVLSGSETMRAVVTDERAVLVSGSSVYDISDCLNPVLAGEIEWPDVKLPGIPNRLAPHDIRVNHQGTRVYGTFGLWEVDISDLSDPSSWTVTDHRCELSAQVPGPWQDLHAEAIDVGLSLCDDQAVPSGFPLFGAGGTLGASILQAAIIWPALSHGPDVNADGTRVYIGDLAGGIQSNWTIEPTTQIVDVSQSPPEILGVVDGPGHGLDWFKDRFGREYLVQTNEGGSGGIAGFPGGDTCQPYPRTHRLGWAFEAIVSDVTRPHAARNVSMLTLAINTPQFCEVRKASGHDPWIAYQMVDNPEDAKFAAVSFGTAGLRVFDIRFPRFPREVAYFNHGSLVHAGVSHYDAARQLLYVPGANTFWVLRIQPQIAQRLGL